MNNGSATDIATPVKGDALAFIWQHVSRIGNCMLVTQDEGNLRARPMRGLARPQDNAIWFLTSRSAHKDNEIRKHDRVCITYSDTGSNTYISLSGAVAMSDEKAQIQALWNPGAEAYFPKGPTDPDILLLKFVPAFGEYWDAPSNPVVIAIQFIKAKVTGEKVSLGENSRTAMS